MFHHWPASDSLLLTVAVGLFSSTANYAGMSQLISRHWAGETSRPAVRAGPLHSRCRARVAGWDKVTPARRRGQPPQSAGRQRAEGKVQRK